MIDIFMLCDIDRYEISVRGHMSDHDADQLVRSIFWVPHGGVLHLDLRQVSLADDTALDAVASAVVEQQGNAVDVTVHPPAALIPAPAAQLLDA